MKIFIFDVPLIFLIGFVFANIYAKFLREKNPDIYPFGFLLVTSIFWLNVLLSNLNLIEPWGISKYGVNVNPLIGIFYVLSYPLWLSRATETAYGLFGRHPSQGGVFWLFTLKERTKPFKPAWKADINEEY